MQSRFPQPLLPEISTVPLIVFVENSILFCPFFVCLNLFLSTITGCPLVLLFWGFLCLTSLCCLGIYRPLFYLTLSYLFSKLENIRLRILSGVSCSLFLMGMGNKETDVKKQLITYRLLRQLSLSWQSPSKIVLRVSGTKYLLLLQLHH